MRTNNQSKQLPPTAASAARPSSAPSPPTRSGLPLLAFLVLALALAAVPLAEPAAAAAELRIGWLLRPGVVTVALLALAASFFVAIFSVYSFVVSQPPSPAAAVAAAADVLGSEPVAADANLLGSEPAAADRIGE